MASTLVVRRTRCVLVCHLSVAALVVASCGRTPAREPAPVQLPIDVLADTGRTTTWHVDPGAAPTVEARASVWMAHVSPARTGLPEPPTPEPAAESLAAIPPPVLEVDQDLRPPLLRERAPLAVPPGARGTVELDVRVDERGEVAEVVWAGGAGDTTLVRASIACARAMRFFPAQRAGRPVAVWCRQRFDFGDADP